jgi:hypothetical protein
VGLRVVVVAAFVAMAMVPAYLAFDAGLLPSPTQASADVAPGGLVSRVTALAWPENALGLAATDTTVLWEQRDPSAAVAGLWSYDVRTGRTDRVLGRSATGKAAGFPAAAGELIVWAAWTGRRGDGPPAVEVYDTASTRRWSAAEAGRDPVAAGKTVFWVEPDGDGPGSDVIRGSSALTDEEYAIGAGGRVRDMAAWGSWAAWISGRGEEAEVWAGPYRDKTRYRLAAAGTAVAIGGDRILWAEQAGRHSTRIVSWDRQSRRATVLFKVTGVASSLTLGRRHAAWVTTRGVTGSRVWVYDFARGGAYPVAEGGRQASPVIIAGSVYGAGDRGGQWELYRRALRP